MPPLDGSPTVLTTGHLLLFSFNQKHYAAARERLGPAGRGCGFVERCPLVALTKRCRAARHNQRAEQPGEQRVGGSASGIDITGCWRYAAQARYWSEDECAASGNVCDHAFLREPSHGVAH